MKKLLFLAALLTCFTVPARAGDIEVDGVLAAAKLSGACGVFKQMVHFQEATQMPGGEEFISRFISTESSRLGWTNIEYAENCKKAVKLYTDMVNASHQDSRK